MFRFHFVRRGCLASALAIACTCQVLVAHAVPFDPAISISGSVSLDTVNSTTSSGNANQSGGLSLTAGGVATSSTFTELTVTGSNPIAQGLTDINDKLGIHFLVGGMYDASGPAPVPASNDDGFGNGGLFGNYTISLSNNSATDTFEISLGVSLTHTLSASGGNSYVTGVFEIKDAALNSIAFAQQTRDTLFGDIDSPLSPTSFLVSLAPGQSAVFDGLLNLKGGAFDAGGYSGDFDAQISVAGVRQVGVQQVPEPGTIALLALGFLAIRRRLALRQV